MILPKFSLVFGTTSLLGRPKRFRPQKGKIAPNHFNLPVFYVLIAQDRLHLLKKQLAKRALVIAKLHHSNFGIIVTQYRQTAQLNFYGLGTADSGGGINIATTSKP